MTEETNFIDMSIEEAEADETKQTNAYFDLIIVEIKRLEAEIEQNFLLNAEAEVEIIKNWSLTRNTKLSDRPTF